MCAGDVAGLIVGDEGVANGAGATAGAGFVVAEPPSRWSQAPLRGPGESYSDVILRVRQSCKTIAASACRLGLAAAAPDRASPVQATISGTGVGYRVSAGRGRRWPIQR